MQVQHCVLSTPVFTRVVAEMREMRMEQRQELAAKRGEEGTEERPLKVVSCKLQMSTGLELAHYM